jgi:hypothetical protein
MAGFGIFPGDHCLCVKTNDIQSGDLVLYRAAGVAPSRAMGWIPSNTFIWRYYPAPGGRIRLETNPIDMDERKSRVYKSEEIVILGRVFAVERNGQRVEVGLRPLTVTYKKGGTQ